MASMLIIVHGNTTVFIRNLKLFLSEWFEVFSMVYEKNDKDKKTSKRKKKLRVRGPTEIWTRIAGFRVQSANHYTMGPKRNNWAKI